jgi:DNA sulfur modification protein DndD
MILDELTLRNFCLFGGEQVLNLAPARRGGKAAPIVLFGGINGGGKTTLLDAVQLVLYGVRARCSKRADKTYEQFLRESIHHGVDPREGAAVQLAFRHASQGEQHLYEVTRRWHEVRGRIREDVRVNRDGEADGFLSDNWNQLVEELIPFGIAQLCFFDAEKIRFLADDESTTLALGGAIKSLLGLDLAERLLGDASVLEGRIAKRVVKSADLETVEQLQAQLDAKQGEVERLVQEKASFENPRLVARRQLKEAEDIFSRIGGEHWRERESRARRVVELEQLVSEGETQLVTLSATELPLALVGDLLVDVAGQAADERRVAESKIVTELLADRDAALLEFLKRRRLAKKSLEAAEEFLREDRNERTAQAGGEERLGLSPGAVRLLGYLVDHGLTDRLRTATELIEKIENGRRELEDLERGQAAIPKDGSIQEVAEQLKAASSELASLDQKIARIEKKLGGLRGERNDLDGKLKKLRRRVVDEEIRGEEEARMVKLLARTQETMTEFLRRATHSKIDRLSQLIGDSFRFLLRKKTLVQRVLIDPETFTITLYDDTGRPVPKRRLSEGEKQIFAVSVLWGLSRASARPLPAIIDTPMARLDAEHRNHLVERYFPHASHQVIVLSTDTEIERQYFHDLQPYIARAYHLNYDETDKMTRAEEGYFWDPAEVADREDVAV